MKKGLFRLELAEMVEQGLDEVCMPPGSSRATVSAWRLRSTVEKGEEGMAQSESTREQV